MEFEFTLLLGRSVARSQNIAYLFNRMSKTSESTLLSSIREKVGFPFCFWSTAASFVLAPKYLTFFPARLPTQKRLLDIKTTNNIHNKSKENLNIGARTKALKASYLWLSFFDKFSIWRKKGEAKGLSLVKGAKGRWKKRPEPRF